MDGLKPERRITGTFLKIREDGEIKKESRGERKRTKLYVEAKK